jgi:hypothetical protein
MISKRFTTLGFLLVLLMLSASSCAPGVGGLSETVAITSAAKGLTANEPSPVQSFRYALRGDPSFSAENLPSEAREWYDEVWSVLTSSAGDYATGQADSDDLYNYARGLHTHILSLLTVFRVTGDLALLDDVARLTQLMRSHLHDSWRGTRDGTNGTKDGYLNWVERQSSSATYRGKDTHQVNEMRAHSLMAQVAWTFQNNRDLESPGGVPYGELADFWQDYLVNHFEAKWRERNQVPWPKFPFLERNGMPSQMNWIRYHHYMHLLTGKPEYDREAKRLSDEMFEFEFREVDTDAGPAYVWPGSRESAEGGSRDYLQPTIYSRYIMADAVDLHFEGYYHWANPRVVTAMANTLSEFIMDNGATDFARDVGGGESMAGLPASPRREWSRIEAQQYAYGPHPLIAAWDQSGKVARISQEVYENVRDKRVYIPAGIFVATLLEQGIQHDEQARAP